MFTGIIEKIGTVCEFKKLGETGTLHIAQPELCAELTPGESVAVSGVCLTVRRKSSGTFEAELSNETLARSSLGLLKSPGACGADIVVGEGQSFGIPMSFGGPHVGLFATQEKFVRQMPGRLCGVAYDKNGNRGFVLTLSTREQHIRREKATSNICTNQGLIALAATIYMEAMGKKGLQEVAEQNAQKAAYAKQKFAAIEGFSIPFSAPTFNEFVVRAAKPAADVLEKLRTDNGIIGGLALSKYYERQDTDFLVCVTETSTKTKIDDLVSALSK